MYNPELDLKKTMKNIVHWVTFWLSDRNPLLTYVLHINSNLKPSKSQYMSKLYCWQQLMVHDQTTFCHEFTCCLQDMFFCIPPTAWTGRNLWYFVLNTMHIRLFRKLGADSLMCVFTSWCKKIFQVWTPDLNAEKMLEVQSLVKKVGRLMQKSSDPFEGWEENELTPPKVASFIPEGGWWVIQTFANHPINADIYWLCHKSDKINGFC